MPRATVVLSAQHYPWGECTEGLDPATGLPIEGAAICGKSWGASPVTRDLVKDHVKTTGHEVRTVEEKVTLYGRSE